MTVFVCPGCGANSLEYVADGDGAATEYCTSPGCGYIHLVV